jgi:hypothetical protein
LLISAWRREGFFLTRTAALSVTIAYAAAGLLVSVPSAVPHALWVVSTLIFLLASLVIVIGALVDQYA